ncbi:hypothetical protein ABBQ38_011965 [Trebouxia sp. C0009 RCD-2024]
MFNCQKDYVTRCQADLNASAVYAPCARSQADIVADSNAFGLRYGFAIDSRNQDIPYYKGIDKMHKIPHPGTRFVSSSATSHHKRVSLFLNILFNALSLDLDELFGVRMAKMGITAEWASRSWVLKNTAQLIPLLEVWNTQYAQHMNAPPHMECCDFERLYTNIETADMELGIIQLINRIFELDKHATHVAIKVWETKPAVWLKQHQVPASDEARSGSGHGGKFMIFDEATIAVWLSFLLANMYVRFGDQIFLQIQGTPMGTNCASHLANLYLTGYELNFLSRLATVYLDMSLSFLHGIVSEIARAFLFTARFIDDLLSINNPYLHCLMYYGDCYRHDRIVGIYPRTLSVTTAASGNAVNYMDITVQRQPNSVSRLTTVLYDKREHQPLRDLFIIKFPHASSNISSTAKYGVITSQYHRLRRIIMLKANFVHRIADIVRYMQFKGHDVPRMMQQVRRLCNRYLELYGTDPLQLYQQIQDAVTRLGYIYYHISCSGHSCFVLELVAGSDQYSDAYVGQHHNYITTA